MIINEKHIEKVKQLIRSSDRPIIVVAQEDNFNRKIVEYGKFEMLLNIECGDRKNTLKNIDSGLNHVLAGIAAKNKVSIGIDLEDIDCLGNKEKALRLTKIRQNFRICRKKDTKIKLLNYKNNKDAFSLLLSLGASTKQAEEAIS